MQPEMARAGPFEVVFGDNPFIEIPALIVLVLVIYAGTRIIRRMIPDRPPPKKDDAQR